MCDRVDCAHARRDARRSFASPVAVALSLMILLIASRARADALTSSLQTSIQATEYQPVYMVRKLKPVYAAPPVIAG